MLAVPKVTEVGKHRQTTDLNRNAPPDPALANLSELLDKKQTSEGIALLGVAGSGFAAVFEFSGKTPIRLDDADASPMPTRWEKGVMELVAKVRADRLESQAHLDDEWSAACHPIWQYLGYGAEYTQVLKGCLVLVCKKEDIHRFTALAKVVADLYAETIAARIAYRVERRGHDTAELELMLGSNRLASLVTSVGASLVLMDREFRIVWHDELASEMAGQTDLRGFCCHEVFHRTQGRCDECAARRTFETGEPQLSSPKSIVLPDGSIRYFTISTTPLVDEDDNVNHVLILGFDITALRDAEQQIDRYKKLVNSSEDFMYMGDEEGTILAANRKLLDELGYQEEEILGQNGETFIATFDREKGVGIADKARAAGVAMDSLHLARKDGSLVPTHIFISHDRDAGIFEAICRDISDRLKMEQEIRERAEELRVQKEKVEAIAEERDRFFRSVSHELRTPLTSIIGFSEILLEDTDDQLTDSQRMQVERCVGNAHKLLAMVNSLLQLSRIESDKVDVELTEVDLVSFLRNLVQNVMPLAGDKELSLSVDVAEDADSLITDEQKLGVILVNLVANAIKFTAEGSVTVSAVRSDTSIDIAVTDTGVGIAKDQLESIFEEFYQVREKGREQRGSGLGLAIARKMAEVLGGTLTVESELGVGSTFTLRIPNKPKS